MPFNIEQPHRYMSVLAGTNGTVFEFYVPAHGFATITHIYCNFYLRDSSNDLIDNYWRFFIDNVDVMGKIERQIGSPMTLERCDPPFIAKRSVRFIAYNGSSYDLEFEVIVLGTVYEYED